MCILCAFKVVCLKWRREVCWHYTHWFALCLSYQHTTYFLCRDFFSLPLLLFDETLSWWICWASENIRAVFVRNCSLGSYAMNKNISLGPLNGSIVWLLASKGQLISKCLFLTSFLPENKRKNLTLLLWYLKSKLFLFVFWKNWRQPKRHFEINWPLEAKALILWVHPVFSWRNDG